MLTALSPLLCICTPLCCLCRSRHTSRSPRRRGEGSPDTERWQLDPAPPVVVVAAAAAAEPAPARVEDGERWKMGDL